MSLSETVQAGLDLDRDQPTVGLDHRIRFGAALLRYDEKRQPFRSAWSRYITCRITHCSKTAPI